MAMPLVDLSGRVFGKLTVLEERLPRTRPKKWFCQCECGKIKAINHGNLVSGSTKSCGCFKKAFISEAITTHGGRNTSLYRVFSSMHTRCSNPKSQNYQYYGGKGIQVCPEWTSFAPFQEWANKAGYSPDLTLDRKYSNKDYSPENCRWVTSTIQNRNREKQKETSSKYIGVSWNTHKQKWIASVKPNGPRVFLGYFVCEITAAKTRDQYIKENNLEGFVLNF
jgi:hypothetical protein